VAQGLTVGELADALFEYYIKLLEDLKVPTTLGELDFNLQDVEALVEGTLAQQRLISLSPKTIGKPDLETIFRSALG
jgi:alcohol dehydrogenase